MRRHRAHRAPGYGLTATRVPFSVVFIDTLLTGAADRAPAPDGARRPSRLPAPPQG